MGLHGNAYRSIDILKRINIRRMSGAVRIDWREDATTQFWTHLLALRSNGKRQIDWRELVIADRCYIGARATLVYCQIPSDSVVGAGSVVTKDFSAEGVGLLVAGNPARVKKYFGIPLNVMETEETNI